MKQLRKHLEKLRKVKRAKYHPLIHKLHKKHRISKKTLFYVKEYGPHSNVTKTIIKESIKILLLASIISSFGGLALESIKSTFITIIPLIILLPTLNDMIGDYGTIISSRFSAMLHENKIRERWWLNKEVRLLSVQIMVVAVITALLSAVISLILSSYSSYTANAAVAAKIILITLIDVVVLVIILFLTSVSAGLYFYRKKEDPNNLLIPITTSVADFGNMIILSLLVIAFF